MDDALVLGVDDNNQAEHGVSILVVMDDALVLRNCIEECGFDGVSILVVMDDALVLTLPKGIDGRVTMSQSLL